MTTSISAIKGVTITPPVIGRIMTGHIEVRAGGKCIPQKDDHFTVTTLVQNDDRTWEPHPINDLLNPAPAAAKPVAAATQRRSAASQMPMQEAGKAASKAQQKLTSIPVRLAFNNPQLNLNSSYSCFDPQKGRVLCTSDGETAKRVTEDGVTVMSCPRPEACEFGQRQRCKNMSRVYLQIEGQDDELGLFILRSTSWNSLNAISARLAMLHGPTGGRMAGMPLMLQLRSKTSAASYRQAIYFADLVFRPGMSMLDAVAQAKQFQTNRAQCGLSQEGLEKALLEGLQNSDFADQVEDMDEWVNDDDFTARAEENLKSSGLRGLDSLRQVSAMPIPAVIAPVQQTAAQQADLLATEAAA